MPKTGLPLVRSKMKSSPCLLNSADRRNRLAAAPDVEQRRRRRHVVVPDVVMHQLLIPDELARGGIERDHAIGVEAVPQTQAAVIFVAAGGSDGDVYQAALGVERQEAPHIGAVLDVPAIALPRLVAGLTRLRLGVERPDQLAGARIPSAHHGHSVVAGDDQILVDHRSGRRSVAGDKSRVAKFRSRLAGPVHRAPASACRSRRGKGAAASRSRRASRPGRAAAFPWSRTSRSACRFPGSRA